MLTQPRPQSDVHVEVHAVLVQLGHPQVLLTAGAARRTVGRDHRTTWHRLLLAAAAPVSLDELRCYFK